MKLLRGMILGLVLLSFSSAALAADAGGKIRIVVVTGGHDFEKEPFFQIFKNNPEVTYQAIEHPNAHALLKTDAAKNWDVLVFYDMHQEISPEAKADFVNRLKDGKGLLVMHHAIADYQAWPEYAKIIGARYYLEKTVVDGVPKARSAYEHGVHFKIHVEDPSHPVTRGVTDFEIHDETYSLFDVYPGVHPLLSTQEPKSNRVICWAKEYESARVVYLQSGHDHFAYKNPSFRKIVQQAIRWTAKRN